MNALPAPSQSPAAARRPDRALVAAVAFLLLGLGAAGCGTSASDTGATGATGATGTRLAAAAAGKPQTLKLQDQLTSESDVRLSATTPLGSQIVFAGMLYEPTGTAAIGRNQAACTRTGPGNGMVFECLMTFILPDGEINAEAASSHSGPGTGVVTGGTGPYSGVRGTFAYTATGSRRVNLTFQLIP